jgi:ubiquitin-conjugating enzyme E2 D/E
VVETLGKGDRRRVVKELEDLSAIFAVHPTDLDRWTVWLMGPAEGPYSAGVWELSVTFPPEYPYRPPTIFFVTPIYHPFVCQTSGKVAGLLDVKTWSPAFGIRDILYYLHSMLVDVKAVAFEPCWSENELMQSMIQQLASDRADFDRVARKWTQAHAVGASHFLPGHPSCACFSPAIRRRALYLMWVARQLEALHGDALLDPWVEFIVPLCVFVPDKTEKEADDLPN